MNHECVMSLILEAFLFLFFGICFQALIMNQLISFDTDKLYIFCACVLISAINELIYYVISRYFLKNSDKVKINNISTGIDIDDNKEEISEKTPEAPLGGRKIKRSFSLSTLDITAPDYISAHQLKIFEFYNKSTKLFRKNELPTKKEIENEYSYRLRRKIHKYVQTETLLQNDSGRLETRNILPFKYINSAGLSTYLIIQSLEEMFTSALNKHFSKCNKNCMTQLQGESSDLDSERTSATVDSSSYCTECSNCTIVEYNLNKRDLRKSSSLKRAEAFRKLFPHSYDSGSSGNVSVAVKEPPNDTVLANIWVGSEDLTIAKDDPSKHLKPRREIFHINNVNLLHLDEMEQFEMYDNGLRDNIEVERPGCFRSALSRLKNFCCTYCCTKNGYNDYNME